MTVHEFILVLDPFLGPDPPPGSYDHLRTNPPEGCQITADTNDQMIIKCARSGATRAEAVVDLVAEIRHRYGIAHADDLGIEKLWEWSPDEFGVDVTMQLLLMASRRAKTLGWDLETIVRLLRASREPVC